MTRKARHRCRTGADAPGLNFRNPDRIDTAPPFHRSAPVGRPSVAMAVGDSPGNGSPCSAASAELAALLIAALDGNRNSGRTST